MARTIEDEDTPEIVAFREQGLAFLEEHYDAILNGLKPIDRARHRLVEAQNDLGDLLRRTNDYTLDEFTAFYTAGGVTAEDWAAFRRRLR